jgi:hypothetical protein
VGGLSHSWLAPPIKLGYYRPLEFSVVAQPHFLHLHPSQGLMLLNSLSTRMGLLYSRNSYMKTHVRKSNFNIEKIKSGDIDEIRTAIWIYSHLDILGALCWSSQRG